MVTSIREDCPVHKTPGGVVCANALFCGLRRDPQGRSQNK